jgi:hypothetical protein
LRQKLDGLRFKKSAIKRLPLGFKTKYFIIKSFIGFPFLVLFLVENVCHRDILAIKPMKRMMNVTGQRIPPRNETKILKASARKSFHAKAKSMKDVSAAITK